MYILNEFQRKAVKKKQVPTEKKKYLVHIIIIKIVKNLDAGFCTRNFSPM